MDYRFQIQQGRKLLRPKSPPKPVQKYSGVLTVLKVLGVITVVVVATLLFLYYLNKECQSVNCFYKYDLGTAYTATPSSVAYYLQPCDNGAVTCNSSMTPTIGTTSPSLHAKPINALALYFGEFVLQDLVRLPQGPLRPPVSGEMGVDGCISYANDASPYIDIETLYSTNVTYMTGAIRTGSLGTMRMRPGGFLPLEEGGSTHLSPNGAADASMPILALHTLWLREHNWWAGHFRQEIVAPKELRDPSVLDEYLFRITRRHIIAEMQAIIYEEWLPSLFEEDKFIPAPVTQAGTGPNTVPASFAFVAAHLFPLYPSALRQWAQTAYSTNYTLAQIEYPPLVSGLSMAVEPILAGLWSTPVSLSSSPTVPAALAARAAQALNRTIEAAIPLWPQFASSPSSPVNSTCYALFGTWSEEGAPFLGATAKAYIRAAFARVRDADPDYYDSPANDLAPKSWREIARNTRLWDVVRRNFNVVNAGDKRNLFLA